MITLLMFFSPFPADNRRKQKRKDVQSRSNYLEFIKSGFNEKLGDIDIHENVIVSPQLALAAFRFLASCEFLGNLCNLCAYTFYLR